LQRIGNEEKMKKCSMETFHQFFPDIEEIAPSGVAATRLWGVPRRHAVKFPARRQFSALHASQMNPDITPAEVKYRPNVAAILQGAGGRVLICERIDIPDAWQFPQGGVEPGETHHQALEREMMEELSLAPGDYKVLTRKGPYRYLIGGGRKKNGFHGQEQVYFLLQLLVSEAKINVKTPHQEFISFKWIDPAQFDLRWLPEMKKSVYRQVMQDFFGAVV
jgi:putative (di)nucleoside polyphosphate hydrolase